MNGNELPRGLVIFGYLVSQTIKLGGLGLLVVQAARSDLTTDVLALVAFMLAGATGAEAVLEKLFGGGKP